MCGSAGEQAKLRVSEGGLTSLLALAPPTQQRGQEDEPDRLHGPLRVWREEEQARGVRESFGTLSLSPSASLSLWVSLSSSSLSLRPRTGGADGKHMDEIMVY